MAFSTAVQLTAGSFSPSVSARSLTCRRLAPRGVPLRRRHVPAEGRFLTTFCRSGDSTPVFPASTNPVVRTPEKETLLTPLPAKELASELPVSTDLVLKLARQANASTKYADVTRKIVETCVSKVPKFLPVAMVAMSTAGFSESAFADAEEVVLPIWTSAFQGIPGAFLHPALMYGMFGATLYAGYLGWKVRETRAASGEEKKVLVKSKFSDRHQKLGSILLALMVGGAVAGMAVTYNNNGKLFPGAHLYVGMAMITLISSSASLSPFMKEGKDWARNLHILLNSLLVLLFFWEVATGTEIVQYLLGKIFESS
mmetsp:Transcript_12416/g.21513  ORF Transcript_12416/g.21513 Transcript_12416/m.21513 type:complete len:313 (-) Transcript_12416:277-1215(-)|eukprot:CAMPEP_0196652832 /NCGR_PEP_ID=MMETSP1086-20130531/2275_1 /TAXON_ID=77921 /ORGANISM="Cyanoptyche  gloeocystis , Strain SAG4.97" /LENGTH=312 /DNA_ID=CAMNT_0041983625 /DNA_START=53 /DNA_END=991 /DNA_ORIENTATION=-